MLETPQERVKLLKAGVPGQTIEKLYLIYNNIKIVNKPLVFQLVEINTTQTKNACMWGTAAIA